MNNPHLTALRNAVIGATIQVGRETCDKVHISINASCINNPFALPYVRDNRIIINVGAKATQRIAFQADIISFEVRFAGNAASLEVPLSHIDGVFGYDCTGKLVLGGNNVNNDGFAIHADGLNLIPPPPKEVTPNRPKLSIVK